MNQKLIFQNNNNEYSSTWILCKYQTIADVTYDDLHDITQKFPNFS